MKTYVDLNTGAKMPVVGYGMWQSENPKELEDSLEVALEAGYRHFDTAFSYNNEEVFGKVLKQWFDAGKVKREELFIVTKLPIQGCHPDRVEKFTKLSLKNLQLDYVDLYLVHNPVGVKTAENGIDIAFEKDEVVLDLSTTLEEVWTAMEAQVTAGRAKAIGISNYSVAQVERIVKSAKIIPANHQVELNAAYPKKAVRELCKKHGITLCAFAPLGSPGRKEYYTANRPNEAHLKVKIPALLQDPIVNAVAKKHSKTAGQVLLRFLAQQEIVVIPKSVTPSRIKENFDIFNFELDADDLKQLDTLDTGLEGTWGFDWACGLKGIETHPEFQVVMG